MVKQRRRVLPLWLELNTFVEWGSPWAHLQFLLPHFLLRSQTVPLVIGFDTRTSADRLDRSLDISNNRLRLLLGSLVFIC